jgi:hypothetical protein
MEKASRIPFFYSFELWESDFFPMKIAKIQMNVSRQGKRFKKKRLHSELGHDLGNK